MYKQTEMLRLSRDKSIRGVNAGRSLAHTTMFYDNLVNMHSTRTNQLTGILFINRIKTLSLKISEKQNGFISRIKKDCRLSTICNIIQLFLATGLMVN